MASNAQRIACEYNWKIRQLRGASANMSNLLRNAHVSALDITLFNTAVSKAISNTIAMRDAKIAAAKEGDNGNS